ncbi:MAG: hypothetical protein ACJ8AI_28545 [Rhodopila sp.]
MTQHDHSATACRNVLTPHRLRLLDQHDGLRRERDILEFDRVHCCGLPGLSGSWST